MLERNETLKDAASSYWRQGISIVLVAGKKPLVDWKEWQTRKQTEEEFEALPWDKADGFAVIAGTRLDNGLYFCAVDFDVKNVSQEALEKGKQALKQLRITRIEETPSGGQHWLYLSHTRPKTISAYHNEAASELLGENKLVIMAPSRGYKRLNDNTLTVVPDIESEFLQALGKQTLRKESQQAEFWFNRGNMAAKPYRGKHPNCIQKLMKGVSEGERNEACIRLSSYLANFRIFNSNKTWKLMLEWNKLNRPSLEQKELRDVFESALKGEYVFGCADPLLAKFCENKTECPLASLTPLELIDIEFEKSQSVVLHPLIDFHPEVGLSVGLILGGHSKSLLFLGTKPFTADFEVFLKHEEFPKKISVKQPSYSVLSEVCRIEMLNAAREYFKNGIIEFPSKKGVFEKTLRGVSHYWYHSDNRYYTFLVCWIIATYFYPIFAFFPALRLQGERETGKTTCLDILHYLAWNPTGLEVALRSADLFRTISHSRVTYLVDITKMSPKSEQYYDIVDIFEVGTEQGGSVRRIDKETGEPISYEIYGPKAIATRYDLPFESKTIGIITVKAEDKEYAKKRAEIKFDCELSLIVRALIKATIKYWHEIVEAYRSIEQTDKLTGRRFNYWNPILAVCKVFAPEKFDELLSLAEEDAERTEKGDLLSEVEDAVLAVLVEYKGDKDETTTMLLKTLTEKVTEIVPWVKDWHIVKSALRNLGIMKACYKSSRGITYQIDLKTAHRKATGRKIESKTAVLTQENIKLVLDVLHEETKDKPYATIQELENATKLSREKLKEILGALQREGKATQPHPDMWRLT